ncbi:MAG: DUF21 domain-containing protein [Victivallales bacterium]|nr:DUF21 domain-containing protein [Victivallales bacterium]
MSVIIYFSLCAIFIMLQAFFGGIETGMVSMRKPRLSNGVKKGDRKAIILEFFNQRPSLLMSSTLLGTNISVVCATLTAKQAVLELGYGGEYPLVITSVILTVILFATDVIPKDWFRQAPYDRCKIFADLYNLTYIILCLPSKLLAKFTDQVIRIMSGGNGEQNSAILIREDFRLFLRESEEGGIMDSGDANILDKAVDFYKLKVQDIMVPVAEVNTVPAECTVAEAVHRCNISGHSRLPVRTLPGNWTGIFSIYDAIYKVPEEQWRQTPVSNCVRPLVSIDASDNLSEIIEKAKKLRSPLLMVKTRNAPDSPLGVVTPLDVVDYLFKK